MARPNKVGQRAGLLFFTTPVNFFEDEGIDWLENNYPRDGVYVYLRLLCRIHKHSYFSYWDNRDYLKFSNKCNLDIDTFKQIFECILDEGVLNKELFDKYSILTSKTCQHNFLMGVARRKKVQMIEEYLLINASEIKDYPRRGSTDPVEIVPRTVNDDNNNFNVNYEPTFIEKTPGVIQLRPYANEQTTQDKTNQHKTDTIQNNNNAKKEDEIYMEDLFDPDLDSEELLLSSVKDVLGKINSNSDPYKYLHTDKGALRDLATIYCLRMEKKAKKKDKPPCDLAGYIVWVENQLLDHKIKLSDVTIHAKAEFKDRAEQLSIKRKQKAAEKLEEEEKLKDKIAQETITNMKKTDLKILEDTARNQIIDDNKDSKFFKPQQVQKNWIYERIKEIVKGGNYETILKSSKKKEPTNAKK